jgi:hypothetical protein
MFGHIHDPQQVRFIRDEVAAHEIVIRCRGLVAFRAPPRPPPVDALQARVAHEPLDPLEGTALTLAEAQLGMTRGLP